jgi:hypothetical protein
MAEKPENKPAERKPEEPKAPPAKLIPTYLKVESTGENGDYSFDIQVLDQQKNGIRAEVRITQGTRKKSTEPIGDSGFLSFHAETFKEEEQEFRFAVLSTDLTYETILDGPEKPKPIKKPKKLVAGGFWANVKKTIKENREGK